MNAASRTFGANSRRSTGADRNCKRQSAVALMARSLATPACAGSARPVSSSGGKRGACRRSGPPRSFRRPCKPRLRGSRRPQPIQPTDRARRNAHTSRRKFSWVCTRAEDQCGSHSYRNCDGCANVPTERTIKTFLSPEAPVLEQFFWIATRYEKDVLSNLQTARPLDIGAGS